MLINFSKEELEGLTAWYHNAEPGSVLSVSHGCELFKKVQSAIRLIDSPPSEAADEFANEVVDAWLGDVKIVSCIEECDTDKLKFDIAQSVQNLIFQLNPVE